jgi:uncharacterized protein YcbX
LSYPRRWKLAPQRRELCGLALATPSGSFSRENVLSEAGRERTASFLTEYLGSQARCTPKFHHVPGHAFTDVKQQFVSLINLDTLTEYERRIGALRHLMRFRANIYFSGIEPWAEFGMLDRRVKIGSAVLHIRRRTPRWIVSHSVV